MATKRTGFTANQVREKLNLTRWQYDKAIEIGILKPSPDGSFYKARITRIVKNDVEFRQKLKAEELLNATESAESLGISVHMFKKAIERVGVTHTDTTEWKYGTVWLYRRGDLDLLHTWIEAFIDAKPKLLAAKNQRLAKYQAEQLAYEQQIKYHMERQQQQISSAQNLVTELVQELGTDPVDDIVWFCALDTYNRKSSKVRTLSHASILRAGQEHSNFSKYRSYLKDAKFDSLTKLVTKTQKLTQKWAKNNTIVALSEQNTRLGLNPYTLEKKLKCESLILTEELTKFLDQNPNWVDQTLKIQEEQRIEQAKQTKRRAEAAARRVTQQAELKKLETERLAKLRQIRPAYHRSYSDEQVAEIFDIPQDLIVYLKPKSHKWNVGFIKNAVKGKDTRFTINNALAVKQRREPNSPKSHTLP